MYNHYTDSLKTLPLTTRLEQIKTYTYFFNGYNDSAL